MMRRRPVRITAGLLAGLLALAAGGSWLTGGRIPALPMDRPLAAIAPPLAGTDDPADPAGAPLRIVAFGTSLTAPEGWPEALVARLEPCLGRPVALSRVAGPGQGTVWALAQTDRVIAARAMADFG